MIDVIFTGLPIAMLLAAAYWIRGGRAARTPGAWSMVALISSFAISLGAYSTLTHGVQEAIALHLAHLVNNAAALTASVSALSFLLILTIEELKDRRRTMRPRLIALGIVLLTMVVCFFATAPADRFAPDEGNYHNEPLTMAVYAITYGLYLSFALADCLRQTWIGSKKTPRRATRIGMRLTGAGFLFAMAYSLYKVYDAAATFTQHGGTVHNARCTSAITPVGCAFGVTVPALAMLFVVVGLTMPVIAWTITQIRRRRWERKTLNDLAPMWEAIIAAVPGVVLEVDETEPESAASDFLLHRRVIEIADGVWSTRFYRSRPVQDLAIAQVGATGAASADSPQVEAAVLADALAGMQASRDYELDPVPLPPGTAAREGDLRAEAQWLLSVAANMSTSTPRPIPPAVTV